ncbi:MAG: ribosome biogenesis GTPase Der [candidate division Zixibacteria bacterium]|nr:ribosome biogenesis GTPase Der [candidate division Zixibacteria bacterium]
MPLPVVAIIGRPNVGKSTLFNRLGRDRVAITDDTPGVTRDRLYRTVEWSGRYFLMVDTGGFLPRSDELFDQKVREQAELAIAEADLVLFLVDAQVGPVDIDQEIAKILRRSGKPTLLVANKADNFNLHLEANAHYSLGLGEPITVSAISGGNTGNLLDEILARLPAASDAEEPAVDAIRVAVIGRPNVGKSSLVNRLLGDDRLIVTEIAGTTRDSIDTFLEYADRKFVLVDTAGLRRQAKVKDNLEMYTAMRTIRALQRADVALVLVEGPEGINHQDIKIIEEAHDERKGIVIVVNKWDLVEKDTKTVDEFTRTFAERIHTMSYIPLIFVSAKTGQRVAKVLDKVIEVYTDRLKRIPTSQLNDFLQQALAERHPPAHRGMWIKFNYVTQTDVAPPTFVFFVNHPEQVDRSYIRYLENRIRDTFGFVGNSLRLKFKRK